MNTEVRQHRGVLRGAMAVCGSWVPVIPVGCNAKPEAGSSSAATAVQRKLAQAMVQYQLPATGEQKCASCVRFIAQSNACNLVDGPISPSAWCTLWVKKA